MSSPLLDRLHADMVAALKARQRERLDVLRMLLAACKEAAIEKRGDLDDTETTAVLARYAKKREENAREMRRLGREDAAAKEETELAVVREYLPEPLGDRELEELVAATVAELGASSRKDMGRVMKAVLAKVQGRAGGGRVSPLVRRQLGE